MIGLLGALAHQLRAGDVVLAFTLALALAWLVCILVRLLGKVRRHGRADAIARFSWQFATLLGLEQAYEVTRGRIGVSDTADLALMHAYRLLDWEWRHGFFVESRIERFFLRFQLIMNAVDLFYVLGHVAVTIGVLLWIYAYRQERYPFVRNMFILTTGIALVVFYLYPMAPPRMLPNYGFVDPAQLQHLVDAGGAQPDSYTYNPYAAMPSLHVGYALVVAWGLWGATRHRAARLIVALYPPAMAAVVIISGNHWLLDIAGAVATVLLSRLLLLTLSRLQALLYQALRRTPLLTRSLRASLAD